MANLSWLRNPVKGVLLDITGVVYNTTGEVVHPIPGSIEAIQKYAFHFLLFSRQNCFTVDINNNNNNNNNNFRF